MRFVNLLVLSFSFLSAGSFASSDWTIDPSHSTAKFKVRHLTISNVYGQITGFKGFVQIDEKDSTKTSANVSLDVSTINTNDAKRDAHLKNADFFDAEKFPVITFKTKKTAKAGKDKLKMVGELSMHGVTKEVTFNDVVVSPAIKDPWGNMRRGLSGVASLNRKDFGITWNKTLDNGGLAVGEQVEINLEVELIAPKVEKQS